MDRRPHATARPQRPSSASLQDHQPSPTDVGPSIDPDRVPEPVRPDLIGAAKRLIALGPRTLGQDTGLVRSPIWHPVSQALAACSVLECDGPLTQVQGPALTIGDQRLFAELFTRWVRRGFPDDYLVRFSIRDLARALGHDSGGSNLRLLRAGLQRLISATFIEYSPDPAGAGHVREMGANLITHYEATSRPDSRWSARLNEKTMEVLLRKPLTYLDGPTWDSLLRRDALAARLWVWLEGENIVGEWRWAVFARQADDRVAELRQRRGPTRQAPIARLLRIDTWSRRAKILQRLRQACAVVSEIDARYELSVVPALSEKGNYVLSCRRAAGRPGRPPASADGGGGAADDDSEPASQAPADGSARASHGDGGADLPASVGDAWTTISPDRRLSAQQREALLLICQEFRPSRVAEAIHACSGAGDAFGSLLRIVTGWRRAQGEAWDAAKSHESVSGPESLRKIVSGAIGSST